MKTLILILACLSVAAVFLMCVKLHLKNSKSCSFLLLAMLAIFSDCADSKKDNLAYNKNQKDTTGSPLTDLYGIEEYREYQTLSERGKIIVDSLREENISYYDPGYLSYESGYMDEESKVERFWAVENNRIYIYAYCIHRIKQSQGFSLISHFEIK